MNRAVAPNDEQADRLPPMPAWIRAGRADGLEDAAFMAGAALSHFHTLMARTEVPQDLLRDRLALQAAEGCVSLIGRPERAADLRDELHLLRAGDLLGPAGSIYHAWRRATDRALSVASLQRALPEVAPISIATWLETARGGTPAARAAMGLEAALEQMPQGETAALITADAILAQAMGWRHMVPLLALGLRRADVRLRGEALQMAVHRAATAGVTTAAREASALTRSTARLRAVAPKLRAKGAQAAVALFLARDALAPTALHPLKSDRAARRLCDRLVDLGAVRELTGRDSFRLYGV